MASAEQLPSGRWRPIVRDGKGNKVTGLGLGTFERKRDAVNAANDAESSLRRRGAAASGTLPPSTKWGEWWDILVVDRKFESDTDTIDASVVKAHLRPRWDEVALNEIRRGEVQKWISDYSRRRLPRGGGFYKPRTIRRIYLLFAATINRAVEAGILDASPLVKIRLPKVPKRAKAYMSAQENVDVCRQLRANKRGDVADAVEFEYETGVRPGELAGMHGDQVDEEKCVLTVRTVYVPRKHRMRDLPKDGDEREVPLTAKAMEIYRRRTAGRDMTRPCGVEHYGGAPCTSDLVFRSVKGVVLSQDTQRQALKKAEAAGELEHRPPYTARRGFATRLREARAHPWDIMEVMGHADEEESHGYAQRGPEFNRQVRALLGDESAGGLRVVGHDHGRGTDRGTDLDSATLGEARVEPQEKQA